MSELPQKPKRTPYITPEGYRNLQLELERLWRSERPKITQEVAAAAAQGDRSENAEYIYGKRKLREIDRRIEFLSKRLDEVTVVESQKSQQGRVFFGAWVTLEDEDGELATYRIVGVDEHDLERGYISIDAPVARALLGKRVGDEAKIVRPKGEAVFIVQSIRYAPDQSSDA
jgi:transcription elongation factor GreB